MLGAWVGLSVLNSSKQLLLQNRLIGHWAELMQLPAQLGVITHAAWHPNRVVGWSSPSIHVPPPPPPLPVVSPTSHNSLVGHGTSVNVLRPRIAWHGVVTPVQLPPKVGRQLRVGSLWQFRLGRKERKRSRQLLRRSSLTKATMMCALFSSELTTRPCSKDAAESSCLGTS